MNRQHLLAFVWLRWRILANQVRRGGSLNFVLTMLFAAVAFLFSLGAFIAFFFIVVILQDAPSSLILYVWAGLVVAFSGWWAMGTLIELQRADSLSLNKFLHLPVSMRGVFILNYLSSLASFTLLLFLP